MTAVNVSFSDFSPPPSGVSCSVGRGEQREEAASSHGDPFFSSVNSRPFRSHLSFHLYLFDYTQPQIIGTLTFPSFEVSLCGIQPGISIRVEEFGKVSVRVSELSQLRVEVFSYFGNGITLNFLPLLSPVSFFLFIFRNGAGRYFLFYTRAWQQFVLI